MIDFNKAVWRIIHCPNSLMTRILKARYFRSVDILNSPRGSQPSYIWKSILWSRDLIRQGIRWQVGDGRSIHAFEDARINGLSAGWSSVKSYELNWNMTEFIDANGSWNEVALHNVFPNLKWRKFLKFLFIWGVEGTIGTGNGKNMGNTRLR